MIRCSSHNANRSVMSDSAQPRTAAHQAPLSMGLYRQESWSGLPFPSPGDLPDPGIDPGSPTLQADALPSEPPFNSINFYPNKFKKNLKNLTIFWRYQSVELGKINCLQI